MKCWLVKLTRSFEGGHCSPLRFDTTSRKLYKVCRGQCLGQGSASGVALSDLGSSSLNLSHEDRGDRYTASTRLSGASVWVIQQRMNEQYFFLGELIKWHKMIFSLIEWKDYFKMEIFRDDAQEFEFLWHQWRLGERRKKEERNKGEKMSLCERVNNSQVWRKRISFLSWAGKCMPNMNQETERGYKGREVEKREKELARECERKNKLERGWR